MRDGQYAIASYPQVSKLTSYQENVTTLAQFSETLRAHALKKHCLFNGQLQQPLNDESRRGKTLRGAPREWVVFDFDKVDAKDHAEVVRRYLPAECQPVSYVVQHSAAMFRPDVTLWSGHIFMLLKDAATETRLREWFEHMNFTIAALAEQLSLTDSGIGLHWPLDRSAAYDSKLIYIAPPKTHGFVPAMLPEDAIRLVKKRQTHLKIPIFQPVSKQQINDKINALREMNGYDKKDFKTRPFEDGEVLVECEPGLITDVRPMGEHYIKFNLNGGDSMGYWIDLRNPAIIKNFKGEPWLQTKQVDEKFYKQLAKNAPRIVARPPLGEGTEVLAFYATNQNSKIKIGTFEPALSRLALHSSTETAARSWLAEFGIVGGGYLPHLSLEFDPTTEIQYAAGGTFVNTFSLTKFMKQEKTSKKPSTEAELTPVLRKLFNSILGNPSQETRCHFLNWLAFIFQTRQKAETAWVFTGRTGTGKGTFVRFVLQPLFGAQHVKTAQFSALNAEFNGYLEDALFVVFEESDTKTAHNVEELQAKLRHYIADHEILIRKMHTDHFKVRNYSNFIFNANSRAPVVITSDDRRFNIPERQENQIFFNPNEWLTLKNEVELEAFADLLLRWPVDESAVRRIIKTQAAQDMHEATTSINQQIADAIIAGDLEFFIDRMPTDAEAVGDFFGRFNPLGEYKKRIDAYTNAAAAKQPIVLKDEDLFFLFRTLITDNRYFQDSKTWRRRHYKALGLDIMKKQRIPGDWKAQERGVLVNWVLPPGVTVPQATAKVVPIKKRRSA